MGWIGCAIQQVTSKGLPGFFVFCFNILILIYYFKYETISTFAPTFWTHIISELGGVSSFTTLNARTLVKLSSYTTLFPKEEIKCDIFTRRMLNEYYIELKQTSSLV